jgi:hypothetical protein
MQFYLTINYHLLLIMITDYCLICINNDSKLLKITAIRWIYWDWALKLFSKFALNVVEKVIEYKRASNWRAVSNIRVPWRRIEK